MAKNRAVTVCSRWCHRITLGSRLNNFIVNCWKFLIEYNFDFNYLVLFICHQHVVVCTYSFVASAINVYFVVVHDTLLLVRIICTHTVSLSTGLVSFRFTKFIISELTFRRPLRQIWRIGVFFRLSRRSINSYCWTVIIYPKNRLLSYKL